MKVLCSLLLFALALVGAGCAPTPEAPPAFPQREWTGAHDAPADLTWSTVIAPPGEPGEPLKVQGRILDVDGQPAPRVLLYVYQTNADGAYAGGGAVEVVGNARRHGRLRGWMLTDDQGRYAFRTIRPAPYPSHSEPAHIHATVTRPGGRERWIDAFWFDDDPLLTDSLRAQAGERGGPGAILELERDESGVLRAQREIRLDDWPLQPAEL